MQSSNSPKQLSAEFSEQSIVEAIVLSDPSIDLKSALDSWDGSASDRLPTFLPTIQQRQFLFFGMSRLQVYITEAAVLLIHRHIDEHVQVYAVLRAPRVGQSVLDSYLSRLSITLQAYASGNVVPVQAETGESRLAQAHQSKELLCAEKIEDVTNPLFITQCSSEGKYTYVIWRASVHVGEFWC